MIKNVLRGLAAAALVVLPLAAVSPAHAAETVPLTTAVDRLPAATESREGYQRTSFKHWNAGLNPTDGCNTRAEVLIWEAVEAPKEHPGCQLEGGRWWSYYDATWVTAASGLDIDHMVPLAEAWDSGASAWTPQRREAHANDQDAEMSLVAVTARSN
ncbi:HNH endonuclease, partial [Streptomyces umbrinus]|uniref:HNH endonuclease n=1 Tax=Streptomyces umbrinus TaxID=67370 RepID=UPI0033D1E181